VNGRLFVALGILLLITNLLCGGQYQRVSDGKALVWNNDPQPEDAVTWSGDVDKNGYATGQGTLVWYRAERAKVTGSNMPTEKRIPISSYAGKMVRGKLTGPVVAADADGKFYHGTFVDGHRTADWSAGAPRVRRGELVEAPSPAEGPAKTKTERSPAPAPTQQPPAQQPLVETAPKASPPPPPKAPAERPAPAVSDSLQSLIAPPSSLRTEVAASAPPPSPAQSTQAAPPSGELDASAAINLADDEARARGYDLDEYERPHVEHATENDTWSVAYQPKGASGKFFKVVIDEKSKKAEIKK